MNLSKWFDKRGFKPLPWQEEAMGEFIEFIDKKTLEFEKKGKVFIPLEGSGKSWLFVRIRDYLVDRHHGRV